MRTRTKLAIASAAMLSASLTYGTCRFSHTRYEPQCDHLPGVCAYGLGQRVVYGSLSASDTRSGTKSMSICEGGSCIKVSAAYRPSAQGERLKSLKISDAITTDAEVACTGDEPVQLVPTVFNTLAVKGGGSRGTLLAPLMGLIDIFWRPRPVEAVCEAQEPEPLDFCGDLRQTDAYIRLMPDIESKTLLVIVMAGGESHLLETGVQYELPAKEKTGKRASKQARRRMLW